MIGIDGKPRVRPLLDILNDWLKFRTNTVLRRLQFRLDKILERLHILDGLMTAYLNLDEVINIIRNEDKPKQVLCNRFKLSDLQADAILDLRLRQLARLEETRIVSEQSKLSIERADLEKTIKSKARLKKLIKKELMEDADTFGDARACDIVSRAEARAFSEKDLISTESLTVILSQKGWIRAAKGNEVNPRELNYRSGDNFLQGLQTRSNQDTVFFDSTGRAYTAATHTLPSARGQGEPLTGRFNPPNDAFFVGMVSGERDTLFVLSSDSGYGFVGKLEDMFTKNKAGKSIMSVPAGGLVNRPALIEAEKDSYVAVFSNEGRLLIFPADDLPRLGRGKGVKMMNIPKARVASREEFMEYVRVFSYKDTLIVHSGKRTLSLKIEELEHYRGERARRGLKLPRGFQRVDDVTVERRS
jgi:topoisomerase-4 subunit A